MRLMGKSTRAWSSRDWGLLRTFDHIKRQQIEEADEIKQGDFFLGSSSLKEQRGY